MPPRCASRRCGREAKIGQTAPKGSGERGTQRLKARKIQILIIITSSNTNNDTMSSVLHGRIWLGTHAEQGRWVVYHNVLWLRHATQHATASLRQPNSHRGVRVVTSKSTPAHTGEWCAFLTNCCAEYGEVAVPMDVDAARRHNPAHPPLMILQTNSGRHAVTFFVEPSGKNARRFDNDDLACTTRSHG